MEWFLPHITRLMLSFVSSKQPEFRWLVLTSRFACPMPISLHLDADKESVAVYASGVVTERDLSDAFHAVSSHKDFDPGFRGFIDLSAVTQCLVSPWRVEEIILAKTGQTSISKWAVLVSDGLDGAILAYSCRSLPIDGLEVFRQRAAALAWLNDGMPPDKVIA